MEELLRSTQLLIQEKFLVLELFTVAAMYYLLMTSIWDMAQRKIEAKFSEPYNKVEIAESR
jgi:polar amino acid transport system permease protein